MIKQDYILDLIRQLSIFLARIAGLVDEERPGVALDALDTAGKQLVGLSTSNAEALTLPSLRMMLSDLDGPDVGRMMVMGVLLSRRASIITDPASARMLRYKARSLLIEAGVAAEGALPIEVLRELDGLEGPPLPDILAESMQMISDNP
ncbi:MAG: hypothetical protein ACI8RZ_005898 [Myxococcota bacterium]|jgi:hypothetical protein